MTKATSQSNRIITVKIPRDNTAEKELYFLFTAAQVEEVLVETVIQPLPFPPLFLLGLYNWRGHLLPVIDLENRFQWSAGKEKGHDRYLVLRTGERGRKSGKQMLRCVVRVSDQIRTRDGSISCTPAEMKNLAIPAPLVRAAYENDDAVFVVPDLQTILLDKG